jgi:hypothetical protein
MFKYAYVFLYVQLCLLIYTLVHTFKFCLPSPFLIFPFSYPRSLIACTGSLTYLAIRSAAYRACLIASPRSIPMLCILGTTRRRDAATTAHSTPSTCQATACVCSAPMAHTCTVLVLSIALSSLLPGAHLCNSRVAVCCSVLQCCSAVLTRVSLVQLTCCSLSLRLLLLHVYVWLSVYSCLCMAISLFMCGACVFFCKCLCVCDCDCDRVYVCVCVCM